MKIGPKKYLVKEIMPYLSTCVAQLTELSISNIQFPKGLIMWVGIIRDRNVSILNIKSKLEITHAFIKIELME